MVETVIIILVFILVGLILKAIIFNHITKHPELYEPQSSKEGSTPPQGNRSGKDS